MVCRKVNSTTVLNLLLFFVKKPTWGASIDRNFVSFWQSYRLLVLFPSPVFYNALRISFSVLNMHFLSPQEMKKTKYIKHKCKFNCRYMSVYCVFKKNKKIILVCQLKVKKKNTAVSNGQAYEWPMLHHTWQSLTWKWKHPLHFAHIGPVLGDCNPHNVLACNIWVPNVDGYYWSFILCLYLPIRFSRRLKKNKIKLKTVFQIVNHKSDLWRLVDKSLNVRDSVRTLPAVFFYCCHDYGPI